MVIKKCLNPFRKIYKKSENFIVTFFSIKKHYCEHYALK